MEATFVNKSFLRAVLDSTNEGVLVLNKNFRPILTNARADEYLSALNCASQTEMLFLGGHSVKDILKATAEGRPYEIEVKSPQRRLFAISGHSLKAKIEGWVLVIRDITKERELQEKLQQGERLAAIGQLAAGIAHDFNNILTSILGYTQLLQLRQDIPPEAKTLLENIVVQGERAAKLIRQILDFSRKSPSEQKPLNLASFLKETLRLFRNLIPETIEIELSIEPGEYWVKADLVQMQDVLMNLIINAKDAIPGKGKITVKLYQIEFKPDRSPPFPQMKAGRWVVIEVADTGCGIPPEVLPHIFEPFFTTKEPGKGSGLGLAQVYGIIKQHNGFIDVKTKVGEGTSFIIYLPTFSKREKEDTISKKNEIEIGKGKGKLILVVEDERTPLEVIKLMLENLGYQTITAHNGEEALKVYAQYKDKICLVIADLVMPKMNGIELIKKLKEQGGKVKIVLMTGYPLSSGWKKDWGEDVVAVLEKPIKINKLAEMLEKALTDSY